MAEVDRRPPSQISQGPASKPGIFRRKSTLLEEITQTTFVKHADGNVLVCVHEDYGQTDGQQISFLGTPGTARVQHVAISDYETQMSDELELKKGDRVIVTEVHEDGWADGKNLRTMKHGIFPMNFVQARPQRISRQV